MPRLARGFTLIELMVVIAIIAIAAGLISLTVRDPAASRLEQEAERLSTLLEAARAESRAMGIPVQWMTVDIAQPEQPQPPQFRFVGLPASSHPPTRWIDERVRAQVVGAAAVTLGPEAILPAQRIVLQLDAARLVVATDGLAPFAVAPEPAP